MIDQLEGNEKTIESIKRDIPMINDEIEEMEVIKFCVSHDSIRTFKYTYK